MRGDPSDAINFLGKLIFRRYSWMTVLQLSHVASLSPSNHPRKQRSPQLTRLRAAAHQAHPTSTRKRGITVAGSAATATTKSVGIPTSESKRRAIFSKVEASGQVVDHSR